MRKKPLLTDEELTTIGVEVTVAGLAAEVARLRAELETARAGAARLREALEKAVAHIRCRDECREAGCRDCPIGNLTSARLLPALDAALATAAGAKALERLRALEAVGELCLDLAHEGDCPLCGMERDTSGRRVHDPEINCPVGALAALEGKHAE